MLTLNITPKTYTSGDPGSILAINAKLTSERNQMTIAIRNHFAQTLNLQPLSPAMLRLLPVYLAAF